MSLNVRKMKVTHLNNKFVWSRIMQLWEDEMNEWKNELGAKTISNTGNYRSLGKIKK